MRQSERGKMYITKKKNLLEIRGKMDYPLKPKSTTSWVCLQITSSAPSWTTDTSLTGQPVLPGNLQNLDPVCATHQLTWELSGWSVYFSINHLSFQQSQHPQTMTAGVCSAHHLLGFRPGLPRLAD